jgi:hypothetical protein
LDHRFLRTKFEHLLGMTRFSKSLVPLEPVSNVI